MKNANLTASPLTVAETASPLTVAETASPLTVAETASPLTIEAVEKVLIPYAFDYYINNDDDFNNFDFYVKAETFDCEHFNAVTDKLRAMSDLYLHSVFCAERFTIVYFFNKYGVSPSMMITLILRRGDNNNES